MLEVHDGNRKEIKVACGVKKRTLTIKDKLNMKFYSADSAVSSLIISINIDFDTTWW